MKVCSVHVDDCGEKKLSFGMWWGRDLSVFEKVEPACSSKLYVSSYHTAWCNIPEGSNAHVIIRVPFVEDIDLSRFPPPLSQDATICPWGHSVAVMSGATKSVQGKRPATYPLLMLRQCLHGTVWLCPLGFSGVKLERSLQVLRVLALESPRVWGFVGQWRCQSIGVFRYPAAVGDAVGLHSVLYGSNT